MKDVLELRRFFEKHRDEDLVLCTLVKKSGSSYRPLGAKKLVARSAACGILSGGCLENAIEKMAREAELPCVAPFSTEAEDDRLLGYQTGCQGVIDVRFERIPAGTLVDSVLPFEFRVKLTVIGCGPDADAFHELGTALGWDMRFLDYRNNFVAAERFPHATVQQFKMHEIASVVPTGPASAIVLMTHNYEADLEILRGLVVQDYGYVGCLGPRARFDRLKEDLLKFHSLAVPEKFERVVAAPTGLFKKGKTPAEIALSTIAEIQARLVEAANRPTWTVVLAAGESKRFGGVKALAPWRGRTLVENAIEIARAATGDRVVVVTGSQAELLQPHLTRCLVAHNEDWRDGMGGSIARGVDFVNETDPSADQILILPVDQPHVTELYLNLLSETARETGRCAFTVSGDTHGPPAALPRRLFSLASSMKGESGLKAMIGLADWVGVNKPEALMDADTPDALAALLSGADFRHHSTTL